MEGTASLTGMEMDWPKVLVILSGEEIGGARSGGAGEDRSRRIQASDSSSGAAAVLVARTMTLEERAEPPEE